MTATAEQAAQAVLLPIGTWRIDHAHSTVGFEAREMTHLVASVHGRFTDFDGTIEVTSTGAQAQGTVRVASITTDHPQRDEDLRSPHFLDAARSPSILFESDAVELAEDHALRIAGRLTFKAPQATSSSTARSSASARTTAITNDWRSRPRVICRSDPCR